MKNINPFEVPEGYFDQMEEQIWEKIRREDETKELPKTAPRVRKLPIYSAVAVAACLILFFGIIFSISKNHSSSKSISAESIEKVYDGIYYLYEDETDLLLEEEFETSVYEEIVYEGF